MIHLRSKNVKKPAYITAPGERNAAVAPYCLGAIAFIFVTATCYVLKHTWLSHFDTTHHDIQNNGADYFSVVLLPENDPFLQTFGALISQALDLQNVMFSMAPFLIAHEVQNLPNILMKLFDKESNELLKKGFQHIPCDRNMNQTLVFHMCADAAKRIQSIETVHFEAWHEAIHDPMFHEKCNFFDMRLACERGIKAPSCTMTAYSGAHYFEFIDDNTPFQNAYRAMLNKGDAQFGVRLSPHGEPVLQTFGAVLFHNYDLVDAMFIMPSYLLAGKPDEIPADIMKVFYAQAGDFIRYFFR